MDETIDMTELKLAINHMLFEILPGDTSIDNMETIAVKMWTVVDDYIDGLKVGE